MEDTPPLVLTTWSKNLQGISTALDGIICMTGSGLLFLRNSSGEVLTGGERQRGNLCLAPLCVSPHSRIAVGCGTMPNMTKWKHALFAITLWGALAGGLSAQTVVDDPNGLRVTVPAQFQVQQQPTGTVCANNDCMVVVTSHSYPNFDAFAANANLAKDGFTRVGEVRVLNATDRHFRASKKNPDGSYLVADTFVRFAPQGGGCTVVALSTPDKSEAAYYAGQEVANNVQFTVPSGGGVWQQALSGKHLVYLYTGNGYSERFDLYLYANGSFSTRSDTSSLSMNGSGATAGGGEGSWRATPAGQLVLSYHNGNNQVYQLAPRQAGNEVSLNGKRFFVISE